MYVCMYVCMGFYGGYNYSGLVRQVSGFITVSVSAKGSCRILDSTGFRGGVKPLQTVYYNLGTHTVCIHQMAMVVLIFEIESVSKILESYH